MKQTEDDNKLYFYTDGKLTEIYDPETGETTLTDDEVKTLRQRIADIKAEIKARRELYKMSRSNRK